MAYPVIASWQDSSSNGSTTNALTCVAPSGISNGDLLIIAVGSDDATGFVQFSINTGTYPGWVKLGESGNSTVDAHFAYFAKDAGGSESDVVVDAASADEMQAVYYRINGHSTAAADIPWQGSADTSSPWTASAVTLPSSTEWLVLSAMSMDGGDGFTIAVSGTGWSKTTQVSSGTDSQANMGCYAENEYTGSTPADCVFTTGSLDDGAALGMIGIAAAAVAVTVSVTGLSATGSGGDVSVAAESTVSITGVFSTGQVGTVTVIEGVSVDVPVTGLQATGQAGSVTLDLSVTVPLIGSVATGGVGQVSVAGEGNALVLITGMLATASVGLVTVPDWVLIEPEDGSGWGEIIPAQSSNWSEGSISN